METANVRPRQLGVGQAADRGPTRTPSPVSIPASGAEAAALQNAARLRYRVQGPTVRLLALREPPPTVARRVATALTSRPPRPVALSNQPASLPEGLSAADAVRAYGSMTDAAYSCTSPAQRGRDLSALDIEQLGLALGDTADLLRCPNHPVRYIARVDKGADKSCGLVDSISGHWYFAHQVVTLTDSKRSPREVGVHEIVHGALQSHDPRDCTNHPNGWSPLLREWQTTMGWSEDGKKLVSKTPGEAPPTPHAALTVWEDMAESFTMYLLEPEKLRAKSKTRFAFAERVIRELRERGLAVMAARP